MGSYSYSTTSGRDNGTWDDEVGYGCVNAYAALTEVLDQMGLSISGSSQVCPSGATFSVDNLPTVDSIIWTCGSNLTITSGQNTNSCIISATGSGSSWVTVRLVTSGGSITLPKETVWAGLKASFTGNSYILANSSSTYTATTTCGISPYTYQWWLREKDTGEASSVIGYGNPIQLYSISRSSSSTASVSELSYEDSLTIEPYQSITSTYYYLSLTVYDSISSYTTDEELINAYGDVDLSAISLLAATTKSSNISISSYPNPTSDRTTIALNSISKETAFDESEEWILEVFSVNSQLLQTKKTDLTGKEYNLDTSGWKKGVYIVRVKYKDEIVTDKLLVLC